MGISKTVTQLGTWTATIVIARLLVPADYGLVGMADLLIGVITLVGDFGLNASIIQKKDVSHKELSTLFWQFVILGISFSGLIYALAPLGCKFWGEPGLLNLIRLSSITFFFSSLSQIPSALLQKDMRFKEYGIVLSIAALSGSIVSIILAYYGMGPYSLILGTLAIVIVRFLMLVIYEPFLPQFIFRPKETLDHLKFGGTITLERYLWWYYSNCDFWLASKFLGKNAYGVYSMAFQLASLPIEKITTIINPVALPAFSKIDDAPERKALFFTILKYLAYISFPIFVGFFWTADDLIHIVLGEKWVAMTLIFKAFVLVFPLRCLATLYSPLLNSIRRADVGVKNMAIGSVLATLAFSIGVQYGIAGLAYSWVLFYPVLFTICLINVAKVTGFSLIDYLSNLNRIVLNMVCMSLAIYLFQYLFDSHANNFSTMTWIQIYRLIGTVITGVVSFTLFVLVVDYKTIKDLISFIRDKRLQANKI